MSEQKTLWRGLAAGLLTLACGSETVVQTTSSTTVSSGAASSSSSTGGAAGHGGAGPAICRDDSDCAPDEACRYRISEDCQDLPQCLAKMSEYSLCTEGQAWNDPGSTNACLCIDGYPSASIVYLECGTRAYPEPIWFGPGCPPP